MVKCKIENEIQAFNQMTIDKNKPDRRADIWNDHCFWITTEWILQLFGTKIKIKSKKTKTDLGRIDEITLNL